MEELKSQYNYKKNSSYTTGVKTKEETFALFLKSFNIALHDDKKVF